MASTEALGTSRSGHLGRSPSGLCVTSSQLGRSPSRASANLALDECVNREHGATEKVPEAPAPVQASHRHALKTLRRHKQELS
eukprot:5772039-Pleurochrysis_carterae.AAC.3